MNVSKILISYLLLLLSWYAQAADIQVAVDRNPVSLNESFQIIFTASASPDGSPDFSPLQDNFEVLDQQRSSNSSWVNGRSNHVEKWIVSVMAKQAGDLLIPPIAFGVDTSKPLRIKVSETQVTPQTSEDMFLDVSATPEKPYVQSQVIYTLRLYRRLQITQAKLDEPQLKDALVEKLGDDSNYNTQINGVDYAVTERKYAIFPQQSGQLTIAPLSLVAEVVAQRRPLFNGFFNQQSTETRRVVSKAITLNVQAQPSHIKESNWLPAELLQLTEQWSSSQLQTKVGEPLTRTLRITAQGATVGQLPELTNSTTLDGLKTYSDQPVLKEDKLSDGLNASREEKIAYIPSKEGRFVLPAIEVPWFNTKTGKTEIAKLPSVTLEALPSADKITQPAMVIPDQSSSTQTTALPDSHLDKQLIIWQGISGLLAVAWLVTGISFYWFYKKSAKRISSVQLGEKRGETDFDASLKQACQENNSQVAKEILLAWGKSRYGVDSLTGIAACCNTELSQEIEYLNLCLYSGQQASWQGESLWREYCQLPKPAKVKATSEASLEPLYKL